MRFAICFLPPSKVLRLPQKSQARSYMKCYTATLCHAKSPWQTWRSDAPKFQPLSGKSAPWPLNMSDGECLLYCACHAKSIFADPLQTPHAHHRFWNWCQNFTCSYLFAKCRIHCTCQQKWRLNIHLRTCGAFAILTSICASRHGRVHFLNGSTSKRAPGMRCFWTFGLPNLLPATAACTRPQLPKVLPERGVFLIVFVTFLTSNCALRYSGVRFRNK